MMNTPNGRRILLIGSGIVVVVAIVLVIVSLAARRPTVTTASNAGIINYTSSITGKVLEDKPDENTPAVNGILNAPSVNILGYESTNGYLSPNQSNSLQSTLNNFLLAHSGLETVSAGIKDASLTKLSDGSIVFTLVDEHPQAAYIVTVKLDNDYDLVQSVTFKRVY